MYNRQEASRIRQEFWTRFGQYMRPVADADGKTVNWLNYKTGVHQLFFRMDADREKASIAIELRQQESELQEAYFEKLQQVRKILEQETGETWEWRLQQPAEDGKPVSRIGTTLAGVNIFNKNDWPAIISFLKPRIQALDAFWNLVKEGFY